MRTKSVTVKPLRAVSRFCGACAVIVLLFGTMTESAKGHTPARCSNADSWWAQQYSIGDPSTPYRFHARQCHAERNHIAAVSQWKKALDAFPTSDPARFELYIWLGTDYFLAGEVGSAKKQWAIGQAFGKKQPRYGVDATANMLFVNGRYAQAFSGYEDTAFTAYNQIVFAADMDASYNLYQTALREVAGRKYDSSVRDLRAVLATSPDAYMAHFLLGDLLYMRNDRRGAMIEWSATLFSFSPDPELSGASTRWHPSHWDALALLLSLS